MRKIHAKIVATVNLPVTVELEIFAKLDTPDIAKALKSAGASPYRRTTGCEIEDVSILQVLSTPRQLMELAAEKADTITFAVKSIEVTDSR